jgi:hypothetical protein
MSSGTIGEFAYTRMQKRHERQKGGESMAKGKSMRRETKKPKKKK